MSNWSTHPFSYPHRSGGNVIELVIMVAKCFSRIFSGSISLDSQRCCLFSWLLEVGFSLPQGQALDYSLHPVLSHSFHHVGESCLIVGGHGTWGMSCVLPAAPLLASTGKAGGGRSDFIKTLHPLSRKLLWRQGQGLHTWEPGLWLAQYTFAVLMNHRKKQSIKKGTNE